MEFVQKKDLKSVEKFVKYFQETCKHLKYCAKILSFQRLLDLAIRWRREEVLLQSNYVVSHTNISYGFSRNNSWIGSQLAEVARNFYGGGRRADQAKNNPDFAPLKVFDIIGYAKTASSPQEAKPLVISRLITMK